MKKYNKKGFTLAELLVVVAIIGILVAISIPVFTAQREKARRAVDMDTARKIKSALVLAYNNEEITIPRKIQSNGYGVWVMLCNGTQEYAPTPYHNRKIGGMWCGANAGVTVGGVTPDGDWVYNRQLETILKNYGLDENALRTYSKSSSDRKTGWDWIIIQVGYDQSGEFISRMYSGFKDQNGAAGQTPYGSTNIEKFLNGE